MLSIHPHHGSNRRLWSTAIATCNYIKLPILLLYSLTDVYHLVAASLAASCYWLIAFVYRWFFKPPVAADATACCWQLICQLIVVFSIFVIYPVTSLLCHCCCHLLCSKCGLTTFYQTRATQYSESASSSAPSSSKFFLLTFLNDFPFCTYHVQSVAYNFLNPNFTTACQSTPVVVWNHTCTGWGHHETTWRTRL